MSASPACPSAELLEQIAVQREASPEFEQHVADCPTCRARIEQIRTDNRFLSGFAEGGGFPAPAPVQSALEIDIPGYDILREIHRGGQGVVYQAVQRSTKREVAIKVMRQGPFATLADRARFEREIETLGRLDHPNLVAVHDAGVAGGFHYFVMNYIPGGTLDEARNLANVRDRIALFVKVCDAVHTAHLRGIIHRDLKPSNVRIDASGEPYVLDFGLAKPADAAGDSAMTRTGQFVGSLPWASPEQVEGASSRIDLRSDVYSLGAILFQLLTGELPFDVGSNLHDAFERILHKEPVRPSAAIRRGSQAPPAQKIDDELDTIVLKCLSKDPQRRYQSAGELATDLRRYLAGEAIDAKRDSALYVLRKTVRRYRVRFAAVAAFVLLLGGFAITMSVLYRRSARLEHAATQSATSLSTLLAQSNIEKGRMAGMLGNLDQAETLVWREFLTHRESGEHAAPMLNEPPGPPEAYWALWEIYRRNPCLRTLTPQPARNVTATVADDGTSLWAVNRDGSIQKLHASGDVLDSYRIDASSDVWMPYIEPSGRIVFAFDRQRAMVWKRGISTPVFEMERPSNVETGGFCVSRTGARVATLMRGAAVVWSTEPFAEVARFGSDGDFTAVAISNDERRLATRDRLGGLQVREIDSGRIVAAASSDTTGELIRNIGPLTFSPDDSRIADAWEVVIGRIWDLNTVPASAIELSDRAGTYRIQSFSPDGNLLAVADAGGSLHVFDAQTGQRLSAFVAHPGHIHSVEFTGDGRGIWTACDGDLRLWEVASSAGVRVIRSENGEATLHSADVAADGGRILAGGAAGRLYKIERASAAISHVEFPNDAIISCVTISRDGRRTAVTTYGNALFIWNEPELAEAPLRIEHPGRVSHAAFSPDGKFVATACDDFAVRIWRCDDGRLQHEFREIDDRVPQVAFSADGRRLAAAVRNGALLVWEAHEPWSRETWSAPNVDRLRAVCFAPDGRWLAAAGAERTIAIWDCDAHQRAGLLVGHNQEIFALDISHDGELIASGDSGGSIRLWHAASRRPLATLEGHSAAVMSVRFSGDGRWLVSASLDGSVRIWDLTYYARHIAGNLETQLRRTAAAAGDPLRVAAWRNWAATIDQR